VCASCAACATCCLLPFSVWFPPGITQSARLDSITTPRPKHTQSSIHWSLCMQVPQASACWQSPHTDRQTDASQTQHTHAYTQDAHKCTRIHTHTACNSIAVQNLCAHLTLMGGVRIHTCLTQDISMLGVRHQKCENPRLRTWQQHESSSTPLMLLLLQSCRQGTEAAPCAAAAHASSR
jgi:hypothetical protein